jgi:hypothetical protein
MSRYPLADDGAFKEENQGDVHVISLRCRVERSLLLRWLHYMDPGMIAAREKRAG